MFLLSDFQHNFALQYSYLLHLSVFVMLMWFRVANLGCLTEILHHCVITGTWGCDVTQKPSAYCASAPNLSQLGSWKQTWNFQKSWARYTMAAITVAARPLKSAKIRVGGAGRRISLGSVDTNPHRNACIMRPGAAQPVTGTHTRLHCVQRQHVSLSRPPSCSPFTVRCCFSVISRLIGGEISSVMAALDWWISSPSYICSTTLLPGSISA